MKYDKMEKGLTGIFHFIATIFFALLFCVSLFITGVNKEGGADEYIIIEHNSPLRMLIILSVFLGGMCLINILYDKVLYKCNRNVLLGITCVTALLLGIYWVSASGTAPQADQAGICAQANAMNDGDYSVIWSGHYLARLKHLLGITTLLRGLFLLFGRDNYIAFQYFNAFMLPLIVFSGCKIVRIISANNRKAEVFYLTLIVTCFPMYAYTAFVYGDLSSTAVALFAAWLLLSCLERFSIAKLLLFMLACGTAVQLRKNTLIILIAFGIVILVRLLRGWDWHVLLTGCAIMAGVFLLGVFVRSFYWHVWDDSAEAIPSIMYVAMGMHDTDGHPGWYDAYNYNVFEESGDDVEASTRIAIEDIKRSLKHFGNNPKYMMYFYKTKINSQWQAPMYQSIAMNNSVRREQSRLVQMIYNEELLGSFIKLYMKAFQVFMYGCILLWLWVNRKKKLPIESYVLLIAVFGGFLFSIIWEAKARYIMPYLLLMIPCYSMGLEELMKKLRSFWGRRLKGNKA